MNKLVTLCFGISLSVLWTQLGYCLSHCVSWKVSDAIDVALAKTSQQRILKAIQNTEKKFQIRILSRQINPDSLKFLEENYPSKPMALKAKTAEEGLIAGLVPIDQDLSKSRNSSLQKE